MARLRERLGRTIRMLRETTVGLSQEKFALSIDLDPSFMGEVERAETNCSIDKLEAIAGGLRMQVWEVIRAAEAAPEDPAADESPATPSTARGHRQPAGYKRSRRRTWLASGDPTGLAREPTFPPAGRSPRMMPLLVVVQQTRDGFAAQVPDLPGCVASAASPEGVEDAVRRAIGAELQRLRTAGDGMPPSRSYATLIEVPV